MANFIWYEINMTSNNTPFPFVTSASNEGIGAAWNAFKLPLSNNSQWGTSNGQAAGSWLQIDYGEIKKVDKFKIKGPSITTEAPKNINIKGSLDGIVWNTITTLTLSPFAEYEIREIDIPSSFYRFFRLTTLSTQGANYASINKLQFGGLNFDDKMIFNSSTVKYSVNPFENKILILPDEREETIIKYGVSKNVKVDLLSPIFNKIVKVDYDQYSGSYLETVQEEDTLFSIKDKVDETIEVITHFETLNSSELSILTDPYDIYDKFEDSVDILYYTSDINITSAEIAITANYSPLDELEGDFEIVTWIGDSSAEVERKIEIDAVPKPQFIKLISKRNIYGYLKDISDSSNLKNYVRYFLSPDDTTYYVWDKQSNNFKIVDIINEIDILNLGMTSMDLDLITEVQWNTWGYEFVNICIFLKDDERDKFVSTVDNLLYKTFSSKETSNISSSSLYVLNTTAKIDVELKGNTLIGTLNDQDLTRVQYRVLLNNNNFYPKDGKFTDLSLPPHNIHLEIPTKDMIIGGVNTLKVEFQDFFGTTDYWLTQFVGEYSGVMFTDEQNKYYSTDAGELIRSLDFGTIIAGQTSQAKVVYVQNKHSFDIQNILLSKLSGTLPEGVELQISKTDHPFEPEDNLLFEDLLSFNDKLVFYVRLRTVKNAQPGFGEFDIAVKADPVK